MTITLTSTTKEFFRDRKVTTIIEEDVPHHVMIQRLRDEIMESGPHHFDMATWFSSRYDASDQNDLSAVLPEWAERYNDGVTVDPTHCGTTGCLAGHMAGFAARHGITDFILDTNSDYYDQVPKVSQFVMIQLMGLRQGSFSSEVYQWHPVAQAAYWTDLTILADGMEWLVEERDGAESDQHVTVTAADIHNLGPVGDYYNHTVTLVDNGDIVNGYYDCLQERKHHAEWVAVCTYLKYVEHLSMRLWQHNDVHGMFPQDDVDTIKASPAFSIQDWD